MQDTQSTSVAPTADPRHLRRIAVMQQLFAFTFHQSEELKTAFVEKHPHLAELIKEIEGIDQDIARLAPERPIPDINKVDLAILRTIMFEWKTTQTPKKVLIDEAVELAKEFGTESSSRFVNGVLAHLLTP